MSAKTLDDLAAGLRIHVQDEFGIMLTHWIVSLGAIDTDGSPRHAIVTPNEQASYIGDGLANAYINFKEAE